MTDVVYLKGNAIHGLEDNQFNEVLTEERFEIVISWSFQEDAVLSGFERGQRGNEHSDLSKKFFDLFRQSSVGEISSVFAPTRFQNLVNLVELYLRLMVVMMSMTNLL